MGASIIPKIPVISVGSHKERFVLVQSNWNILDHLWRLSTLIGRTSWTEMCHSILPNWFIGLLLVSRFHLCREFGKGIKNG